MTADWYAIPGGPNQKSGPDAFKPIFENQPAALPDLTITIQKVVGCAGQAAVRTVMGELHLRLFRRGFFDGAQQPVTRVVEYYIQATVKGISIGYRLADGLGVS